MKFTTPARRMLAAGAVSALAAGTLVGATTTTAQAAPITNDYFCDGQSADFPMTIESDIPVLAGFSTVPAGMNVATGLMEVANTVTVPTAVLDGLEGASITRVESPNFAGAIGSKPVLITGVGADIASATDNGNGFSSLEAPGINTAFEVPRAGTYDVTPPASFTLDAKNSGGVVVTNAQCALTGDVVPYATVTVVKNASTSNATAVNSPVRKGDVAKVKAKVTAPNEMPSGKVLLKKGTKTLTSGNLNDKGVVVLKTKALPVGKTKLKTVYKGDGYTKPSSDTVVFTVKR